MRTQWRVASNKFRFNPLLILTMLAMPAFFSMGCSVKQDPNKPHLRLAATAFDHSGFDNNCTTCHEVDRPSASHNPGQDCTLCHRAGTAWLDLKAYNHRPLPTSCNRCHEKNRPAPIEGLIHGAGNDCVSCHTAGTFWGDLKPFNHEPPPRSCATCHERKRPKNAHFPPPGGVVPGHYGLQDCVYCHQGKSTTVPHFLWAHADAQGNQVPTCLPCHEERRPPGHHPEMDCAQCHLDPNKDWLRSVQSPHPENNPMPVACGGCHREDRPTPGHFAEQDCIECHEPRSQVLLKFEFDHSANGNARTSCLPCHAAERPEKPVNRFSHSYAGQGDCIECHNKPGSTWSGGVYKHHPAPTACAVCHASDKPAGVVHRMDHAVVGAKDCAGCHKKPGLTWAGGTYGHSPVPTTCQSCHSSNRPTTIVNRFLHSYAGTGDCASCHKKPGVAWNDGTYTHAPTPASCSVCHELDRLDSTHYTGMDCVDCHTKPGETWENSLLIRGARAPRADPMTRKP